MGKVAIVKVLLRKTREYNEQHQRRWYTQVTQASYVEEFRKRVEKMDRVTPTDLCGVAGNLLRPSSAVGRRVDVPYGWDSERFRFVMMVETGGAFSAGNCVILTGHTSHAELDRHDNLSDDMEFIVNNSTITRYMESDHTGTVGRITNVLDAAHVHVPPEARRGSGFRDDQPGYELMTPMDVAGEISFRAMLDGEEEAEDLRNGFQDEQVRRSRRSNGLSSAFMSTLFNGVRKAELEFKMNNDPLNATDEAQFYAKVRTNVREQTSDKDDFMAWLEDKTDFKHHRTITWGELRNYFPNIESEQITKVLRDPPKVDSMRRNPHGQRENRGRGQDMSGAALDQVTASTLAFAVPAIMMDHLIQTVTFEWSNMTRDGKPFIDIHYLRSFVNADLKDYEDRFVDRLESEIIDDLTDGGRMFLNVRMKCDTLGESHIDIEIDGCDSAEFVIPSFADASFAPTVTSNHEDLQKTAVEFSAMLNTTEEDDNPRAIRRGGSSRRGGDRDGEERFNRPSTSRGGKGDF